MPPPVPHRAPTAPWRQVWRTWGVSLLLAPLCGYLLWAYATGTYTLLDAASLVIHEAGHVFLRPFGWTLHLLGGSLFQLILPGLFVGSFFRTAYRTGVQVSLVWLGQNALNVGTYVADAQERLLPLLTGNPKHHDWWQLLRAADLLAYDDTIGHVFLGLALVAFAASLALPRVIPTP